MTKSIKKIRENGVTRVFKPGSNTPGPRLTQILSTRGGERLRSTLRLTLPVSPPPPNAALLGRDVKINVNNNVTAFFAADEGIPYPNAFSPLPLTQVFIVKAPSSNEVWKVGLEAVQTGLFEWVILKPSQPCSPVHLRRLQLQAERTQAQVVLLPNQKLPHWLLGRKA